MMEILIFTIKTFTTPIIAAIAGVAIGWARAIKKTRKEEKERDQNEREKQNKAIKMLIHSEYFRCCKELISQETISDADHENFTQLHEVYTELGMNGHGEWYYRQIEDKKNKLNK